MAFGRRDIPAGVIVWGAGLFLAAWIVFTGSLRTVGGIPGPIAWFGLVAVLAMSTWLGARTAHRRLAMVLVVVGATFVAGSVSAIFAVAYLHVAGRIISVSTTERLGLAAGFVGLLGLVGLMIGRRRKATIRPAELLVGAVVLLFVLSDRLVLGGQLMRDLRLDLRAGDAFFHGHLPYITTARIHLSADRTTLPFLYPPFTLPFFAILSRLPELPVLIAWLATSVGAAAFALRALGVRLGWIPLLLLWPPFVEGLAVGNVAVLTFAVFALAPRWPAALPAMAVFKVQSAIPSLWLLRERRWRSLILGSGIIAALVVLTLPMVGLASWSAWFNGLLFFQQAQRTLHGLYGLALPGYVPYAVYLVAAIVVLVVALVLGRGFAGLARLGIASIVASPSLYRHGFLVALPGLLGNDEVLFWLALGVAGTTLGWWLLAGIAFAGTFRFATAARHTTPDAHPLDPQSTPWMVPAGQPASG